jgi:hypothetical protein
VTVVAEKDVLLRMLGPHWRRAHGDEPMWIGCKDGWLPLIQHVHEQLVALAPDYGLREVFQKYGVLVVRVSDIEASGEADVRTVIADARVRSSTICETCGEPGRLCGDPHGWLDVVCPHHEHAGGYVPWPGVSYDE